MNGPAKILTALVGAIVVTGASLSVAIAADYPQEWAGMDGSGLATLAGQLKTQGAPAADQRKLLAEYVASKHLTDDAAAQGVSPSHWQTFTESLGPDMSSGAREGWRVKLRSAFGAREVSGDELGTIQWVLALLDDKGLNEFAAGWVQHQDCWKSWPAEDLVTLGKCLGNGRPVEASVTAARQAVVEHIMGTYLSSQEATLAVASGNWPDLAQFYSPAISSGQRDLWAGALRRAYASDEKSLRSRSAEQVGCLGLALAHLVSWGDGASVAFTWLEGRGPEELSQVPPKDLEVMLVLASLAGDKDQTKVLMTNLEPVWLAKAQRGSLDSGDYEGVARAWLSADDPAKARQWAMTAHEAVVGTESARASLDLASLRALSELLKDTGLTGKGRGFPKFATVLASLARNGELTKVVWDLPYYLAFPLGDDESRAVLKAELTDAQGNPRRGVADMLAWSYRHSGELGAWTTYLDSRIAQVGEDGDTKARWLLCRAYAESIVLAATFPMVSPLEGKQFIDQALSVADSTSMRLEVIRELVVGYAACGSYDQGLNLLESFGGQFTDMPEAAAEIDRLRRQMTESKAEYAAELARYKESHEQRLTDARQRELKRRLARARAKDDGIRAGRVEAVLEGLSRAR